MDNQKIFN